MDGSEVRERVQRELEALRAQAQTDALQVCPVPTTTSFHYNIQQLAPWHACLPSG